MKKKNERVGNEEIKKLTAEAIGYVKATMAQEGIKIDRTDIINIKDVIEGNKTDDEIVKNIIEKYSLKKNDFERYCLEVGDVMKSVGYGEIIDSEGIVDSKEIPVYEEIKELSKLMKSSLLKKLGLPRADKLNEEQFQTLYNVEREITSTRLGKLIVKPIKGKFDLKHLQKIHKHTFKDIYTFAGKIRSVDISKGSTQFCFFTNINSYGNDIFEKLAKENFFKGKTQEQVAERLAYYFGEINALHPFREGNGRTQREFIRQLALEAGYKLNYEDMDTKKLFDASVKSMIKHEDLSNLFSQNITLIQKQKLKKKNNENYFDVHKKNKDIKTEDIINKDVKTIETIKKITKKSKSKDTELHI